MSENKAEREGEGAEMSHEERSQGFVKTMWLSEWQDAQETIRALTAERDELRAAVERDRPLREAIEEYRAVYRAYEAGMNDTHDREAWHQRHINYVRAHGDLLDIIRTAQDRGAGGEE